MACAAAFRVRCARARRDGPHRLPARGAAQAPGRAVAGVDGVAHGHEQPRDRQRGPAPARDGGGVDARRQPPRALGLPRDPPGPALARCPGRHDARLGPCGRTPRPNHPARAHAGRRRQVPALRPAGLPPGGARGRAGGAGRAGAPRRHRVGAAAPAPHVPEPPRRLWPRRPRGAERAAGDAARSGGRGGGGPAAPLGPALLPPPAAPESPGARPRRRGARLPGL
mmetsp:Transcript_22231/g.65534  ORF Transcript_22231/g.65534 Transcript_22231/m.65534 type:complete len:225 (-) Transcript_22231:424-1098(-)